MKSRAVEPAESVAGAVRALDWKPAGGGKMGAMIRAFDWAGTPVGPMAAWPVNLRVALELCLNSRSPMFIWWGIDLINMYNDAYAPIMGSRHPAGLGKPARELWSEAWAEIGPQTDAVMLRGESTWNERRRLILERNGYPEECYFTWSYSPILDEQGKPAGLFCAVIEETGRVLAERERDNLTQAVERERMNLTAIIEQSPAFMAVLRGPEHVFELANERFYDIAGRRDVIGKTLVQAFPDIQGQGFDRLLDEVYRTGKTFSADELPISLARRDGSIARRYMNLVYQALRDAEQKNSGVFVHGVDVTEMVLAREALKQTEEFHRYAAEAGRTGSWNASLETMEASFSPMMCELVGFPPRQTILSFEQWFHRVVPEDRAGMQAAIAAAIERDEPYDYEFQITLPDGSRRWLASRGGAIRDASGKAIRIHGATVDITEKKRLAQEREKLLESERAARAAAEHASRAKDKFLAVLSHELRTPLSPVVMTLPAMEQDPSLPAAFREDLAMMRRNIELEVKLIDDLLDLNRITTGKLQLQLQSVRVHELLRHVVQSSKTDIAAKNIHLREHLNARNDHAVADPARLQQVFWNLLRNAIKFTPEGGTITLGTTDSPDGLSLQVDVQDTGVGIPPEVLPRVFDAFEQGDARVTRQFGGLGLGLAISKAVVEMLGGSIRAKSEGRDRGSTFTVNLKTQLQNPTKIDGKSNPPGTRKPSIALTRVLLVEDHPDTSYTMARLLKSSGFAVSVAHNVAGARQMLAREKYDVLVSDIGLPDATGYELMQEVRSRYGIPGVALSGYGMEEDIRKSQDAGFTEHLVKPINIDQLQGILRGITPSEPN